ncbi:MAG: superoxide dismutase [Gammaproteobacteria bacterium]|nr:superoxide dismutase [Gammaproteobacteria bacterium]
MALVVLFDRTTEYQEAIRRLDAFKRELPKRKETEARQRLTAMGREVGTLVAQDFFPGQARGQMEAALADAEAALNARFAPDEPHAAHWKVPRREINRLTQALNDSNTPPYIYNGLKREQLIRTGSVVLHELYFGNLGGDGKASAELRSRIAASFGTFDAWESEFRKVGQGLGGGSGWVVLGFNERLKLLENYWLADHASNPPDTRPILVMDMYEHAYQMDYGAAAPKYIDAFFTNINWDAVANRM